ncbi:MAG: hypothetical protein J6Z82_02665 [Schwartzia sp.]|nr:hypothetical protein [Schwartzia sp. (in: firmicutes)]
MRRDYSFDFDEEEKQTFSTHRLNMHPVIEPVKKGPMFTRGQMTSMVLAVALLVYALIGWDVPLAFLMLSFLSYLLRPLAEKLVGVWLSNLMKGFSVAMGMGAVVLAFL